MPLLLALFFVAAQAGLPAAVEHALAAGDFEAAERVLAGEPAGPAKQRAMSEMHYRARDPAKALAAARAGLAEGDDLFLLHRAAASALWLGRGNLAQQYSERLARAVSSATLSAEERAGWDQTVGVFVAEARTLMADDARRDAVVQRGQIVAAALLLLAVALMLYLLRADGRALREGRADRSGTPAR